MMVRTIAAVFHAVPVWVAVVLELAVARAGKGVSLVRALDRGLVEDMVTFSQEMMKLRRSKKAG